MSKKLLKGEVRFVVKKVDKKFRVYDKAHGSFPYHTPELGTVLQDVSEEEAEAESIRLNSLGPLKALKQPEQPADKETPTEPLKEPEIKDYGVLSEEERARYEDGLMEKVVY